MAGTWTVPFQSESQNLHAQSSVRVEVCFSGKSSSSPCRMMRDCIHSRESSSRSTSAERGTHPTRRSRFDASACVLPSQTSGKMDLCYTHAKMTWSYFSTRSSRSRMKWTPRVSFHRETRATAAPVLSRSSEIPPAKRSTYRPLQHEFRRSTRHRQLTPAFDNQPLGLIPNLQHENCESLAEPVEPRGRIPFAPKVDSTRARSTAGFSSESSPGTHEKISRREDLTEPFAFQPNFQRNILLA